MQIVDAKALSISAATAQPKWGNTLVLLGSYALLLCLRAPQILIKGRFWAEEGTIFFKNAWRLPPWQALFTSYAGYLNFPANAAAVAARWALPLELAPYLTIAVSLAFHLLAPLLLLTSTDAWTHPLYVRLACMLMLLLTPQIGEGLLQTLHCQFQMALCCGLILALDVPPKASQPGRLALLSFAPLCGLVSIATLPLFLARAWSDRSKARLWQAAALSAGAAVQLLFFFHNVAGRTHDVDPILLLSAINLRYLESPFRGLVHADLLAKLIRNRLATGQLPLRVPLLPVLVFVPLIGVTLWTRRTRPAFWLLAAGIAIAGFAALGALGGARSLLDAYGNERYVFVSQTLFGLTMVALAATCPNWIRWLSCLAVLWLFVIGANCYMHPWPIVADGRPWRNEIALWRADPSHVIQLWPAGWAMTLTK